jgi:hypothetical protein
MKKLWLFIVLAFAALAGAGTFIGYFRPKPQYPQYCRLVFGPKAQTCVLVRFDGKSLALDLNRDGKFDGKGERFASVKDCKNVVIPGSDAKTKYVITAVHYCGLTKPPWTMLIFDVDIKGPLPYRQIGDADLATDSRSAPEAHFHGPLTAQWPKERSWMPAEAPLTLPKGGKPVELRVVTATMNAKNNGGAAVRTTDESNRRTFPKGIHPFVDVEFPPGKPGGPPIRKRYPIEKVC